MMGNLTENFSTWEFSCNCCGAHPPPAELRPLAEALQKLRDLIAEYCPNCGEPIPIHVNCGYRCKQHNREVGGSKTSRHLTGQAADVFCYDLSPTEIAKYAAEIPEFMKSGIGIYDTFVHLDIGRARRWRKY